MTDSNQKQFIQNIRRALGKPPNGAPVSDLFHIPPADLDSRLKKYADKHPERRQRMLNELIMRAEAVQMQVSVVEDGPAAAATIRDLALSKAPEWGSDKRLVAWHHPLINDLKLEACLQADNIPVATTRLDEDGDASAERMRLRNDIEAAYIGITSADFVVAHTATMVMKSRPHELRAVSLVPSIHVCVVTEDQLVTDLGELYTLLQWEPGQQSEGLTNCMTFISAPSKTGDIELVMVNGAHGPREVHVIVIRGS